MHDFFRGWKRKAGVATLVMACVFMACWVRSDRIPDEVILAQTRGPFMDSAKFQSRKGILLLTYFDEEGIPLHWVRPYISRYRRDVALDDSFHRKPRWTFRACGFGVGTVPANESGWVHIPATTLWAIPHWSIILPLTLLSAYLLLSKPRATTPMKTSEPAPPQAS